MTASNNQYHVKKKIADFDACSLYPSAMHFMDGLLEDRPNVLNDKSYEFLKQQDIYFVRAKINKLNKHLGFPLTSNLKEDSGVRYFIDQMDNGIIYIGKVGLEDIITYHEAGFEIIDGYYYDQGRNDTIKHVIEGLYNPRLKLKQDKNPAQFVIKLLMNSMYGKTIIKPVETDTIVKGNRDDFGKYISYNISILIQQLRLIVNSISKSQINLITL